MADDSILKYSDIIAPDDTFEVIFQNLDKLRSELESLAQDAQKSASIINPNDDKAIEELTNNVKELESALASLDKFGVGCCQCLNSVLKMRFAIKSIGLQSGHKSAD